MKTMKDLPVARLLRGDEEESEREELLEEGEGADKHLNDGEFVEK